MLRAPHQLLALVVVLNPLAYYRLALKMARRWIQAKVKWKKSAQDERRADPVRYQEEPRVELIAPRNI